MLQQREKKQTKASLKLPGKISQNTPKFHGRVFHERPRYTSGCIYFIFPESKESIYKYPVTLWENCFSLKNVKILRASNEANIRSEI